MTVRVVWLPKTEHIGLLQEINDLRRELSQLRQRSNDAITKANTRARAYEDNYARLLERVFEAERRPPVVVEPPDTAQIVREAINGVAVIVNGWKQTPDVTQVPQLTFDTTVDEEKIDEFIPPWENMGPPTRGGWINPPTGAGVNGEYTPYIPGAGNVVPPEGGVE